MKVVDDNRIIMTLDASGSKFFFTALRKSKEILSPIRKPAYNNDLRKCLDTIVEGFHDVEAQLPDKPAAISFAFPGPADYLKGVIVEPPNFPAFRGGVALGPMLEEEFGIPVFINNDGNLFTYGEALAGFLPDLNKKLKDVASLKTFRTLIGLTLGPGFGSGIVIDKKMLLGNNTSGAEVHNTLNKLHPEWNAEESVSIRAIQRVYGEECGDLGHLLSPVDIMDIATGKRKGSQAAAEKAFEEYGAALGYSIANLMSLIDGIVVIGGELTSAWDLFHPAMFDAINKACTNPAGEELNRLSYRVYNLEDPRVFTEFAFGRKRRITVPGSKREVEYDELARSAVGLSKLGVNRAIALGAYAFALQQLDLKN